MALVPDHKNWTWVLERRCPECGFKTSTIERVAIAGRLEVLARAFADALGAENASTRTRSDRWSVLEYGCHVRDVFRIFDLRLARMLDEMDPVFDDWDQDRTAIDDHYALQDPGVVALGVLTAVSPLSARLDAVHEAEWSRPGRRSDGSQFTVETLARYLLHDPVHHLWDLSTLRG